jgi:NitT/TauT family transport system permease protein
LTEMVLGYVAGAAFAIACGLCLGLLPRVERITAPVVTALYALPKIALTPLFVIAFGIGLESKIVLVASTVFFLILYNTLDGVRDIDRDLVEALEIMGATQREIVHKALVPATMPWIFTGLRVAVRYAFTAAILGELMASNEGIGYLIEASAGDYNTAGVYAAVFVLVVFSVLFTELLTRTEASSLRWRV